MDLDLTKEQIISECQDKYQNDAEFFIELIDECTNSYDLHETVVLSIFKTLIGDGGRDITDLINKLSGNTLISLQNEINNNVDIIGRLEEKNIELENDLDSCKSERNLVVKNKTYFEDELDKLYNEYKLTSPTPEMFLKLLEK